MRAGEKCRQPLSLSWPFPGLSNVVVCDGTSGLLSTSILGMKVGSEACLEAEQGRGHAEDVNPAASLQRVHNIALAHTSELALQVAAQPTR